MANRSYLYSTNFISAGKKKSKSNKISGLGEYNYSIPIAFEILVSAETQIVPSLIWKYKHPIAIGGNFEKGLEKLFQFLDELPSKDIFPEKELAELIMKTKEFLHRSDRIQKYIHLECGEIFEMDSEEMKVQNEKLVKKIKNIDQEIQEFYSEIDMLDNKIKLLDKEMIRGDKKIQTKISKLKNEKWFILALDCWNDCLYFDLEKG